MRTSAILLLALLPGIAGAETRSPECTEAAAKIMEATGAEFVPAPRPGTAIRLRHPGTGEITLSCTTHRLTRVTLGWRASGLPPNDWFGLAAKTGAALTGVGIDVLNTAIHQCHRAALRHQSETAELDIPNAFIECQAFTRDGGGVLVSVWVNDREARTGIEE